MSTPLPPGPPRPPPARRGPPPPTKAGPPATVTATGMYLYLLLIFVSYHRSYTVHFVRLFILRLFYVKKKQI